MRREMTNKTTGATEHSVIVSVQVFLQPDEIPEPHLRSAALLKKVQTAILVLPTVPLLQTVALNAISVAFQHHLTLSNQGINDEALSAALNQAYSLVDSLIAHTPSLWIPIVIKWVLGMMSQLSALPGPPVNMESTYKYWLSHPVLQPVITFLHTCAQHFVSTNQSASYMEWVFSACSAGTPNLNWLLAYCLAQHPALLIPHLLNLTLSLQQLERQPVLEMVWQSLGFLSQSCCQVLKACLLATVRKTLTLEEGGTSSVFLLKLVSGSPAVLRTISSEALEVLQPSKIVALVEEYEQTKLGQATHTGLAAKEADKDEGEIHSSDEEEGEAAEEGHFVDPTEQRMRELTPLVSKAICMMCGDDAGTAVQCVIELYLMLAAGVDLIETSMEEGEIESVSIRKLLTLSCKQIMCDVIKSVHSTALQLLPLPSCTSDGTDMSFVLGLYGRVRGWCTMLLEQDLDSTCLGWIYWLVGYITTCSSELQAADVVAHLLCVCGHKDKLKYVYSICQQAAVRHPGIAGSVLLSAMTMAKLQNKHRHLENFSRNMLTLIKETAPSISNLREQYQLALTAHTPSLTSLLPQDTHGGLLLDLLLLMGEEPLTIARPSAQCKMVSVVLTQFFKIMAVRSECIGNEISVDLQVEIYLVKCRKLLVKWLQRSPSLKTFAYSIILGNILSKQHTSSEPPKEAGLASLLAINAVQDVSIHSRQLTSKLHTGSLPVRMGGNRNGQLQETSLCADHLIWLISDLTRDTCSLFASVFVDQIAPFFPVDISTWPENEFESTSKVVLEWDLELKRLFDVSPVLWRVLLLISQDSNGCALLICANVIRGLLSLLISHWRKCKVAMTKAYPKELDNSEAIIECMARSRWLPQPLCYVGELFALVNASDMFHILTAVYMFVKENFETIKSGVAVKNSGHSYTGVIQDIMVQNIDRLGHLFARYATPTAPPPPSH